MVYKKQVLYVYTLSYESGGQLFPMVCDRTIVGLMCGQLTFMGYSIIRGGHYQPLALAPLVYFSFWTMNYFKVHYAEPSNRLTLERAMELDGLVAKVELASSPRRRKTASILIPQDSFSSDHYKQAVLTEKHSEPLFYREDREDELTVEAREKLSGGLRANMWHTDRDSDAQQDHIIV